MRCSTYNSDTLSTYLKQSMKKYLYGASVQGIQNFIFQTNKLKDIIGASELVKNVCDHMFKKEFLASGTLVVSAAGNVKCIYDQEAECRNAVLRFPKRVMEQAPGVTISQAVVEWDGNDSTFRDACNNLEKRLHAQRSKRPKNLVAGLMAMERSRTTGLPAVETDGKNGFLDECTRSKRKVLGDKNEAQLHLCSEFFGRQTCAREVAFDFTDLTRHNEWIAIVHADGNALGEVVARKNGTPAGLRDFSLTLDSATKTAAQQTCRFLKEQKGVDAAKTIRPIILGGDDLTIVCSADIAVDFVQEYLRQFEAESEKQIGEKLTACAGIAFIKATYPFHYGYALAETLCGKAKADAKSETVIAQNGGKVPSCLMFHKVQSSFVEDFADIEEKELIPHDGHSYCYGPYYLYPQAERLTIGSLLQYTAEISREDCNNVKTAIRRWLTDMATDVNLAEQKRQRALSLFSDKQKILYDAATKAVGRGDRQYHLAYDLLALNTVKQQCTK